MTVEAPLGSVSILYSPEAVSVKARLGVSISKALPGSSVAQVDFDGALGELQLNGAVVEIQEGDAGLAGETNGGGADVNFAAGILVGPEIVAGGQGAIGVGLDPVIFTGRLKGNGALQEIQARDASGRVGLVLVLAILVLGCGGAGQREK